MRAITRWCRYGSVLSLLAGGALARGQDAPPTAPPSELPVVVEAAEADAKAPPAAPADARPAPAADGQPCQECKPWTAKVPVVDKFPPLGLLVIQPDGPGYYSLDDVLRGNCRQAPPKYPYPRYGLMPWSF